MDGVVTRYDYLKLFVENISLWEIALGGFVLWVAIKPDILRNISRVKPGNLEIDLRKLKKTVEDQKQELQALESDIENERRLFGEILGSFDPHAPVDELARSRSVLKAHARSLSDLDELRRYLVEDVSAEELYAAAVTLRERRPTQLVPNLLTCLDRLAEQQDLGGIRLHTVWTLTSAFHKTLIAAIRDGARPETPKADLLRAKEVLAKFEVNPRVQQDRPDDPDKGVRGPIRFALTWVERLVTGSPPPKLCTHGELGVPRLLRNYWGAAA